MSGHDSAPHRADSDNADSDKADSNNADSDQTDESLPRSIRLRQRRDFLRVQRTGRRVHTEHFILIVSPRSDAEVGRLGITVTKKVADAVGRNRVKRVVREVFRRNRHFFPQSYDLVVIAKSGAPLLGYEDVRRELRRVRRPLAKAAASAVKAPR